MNFMNFLLYQLQRAKQKQSTASSLIKTVYNPKVFIPHATSLGHTFVHCRRFSTAATRRCLASVSVPMLGVTLSRPLPVIALVSFYLTNKLIGGRPLPFRTRRLLQNSFCYKNLIKIINYNKIEFQSSLLDFTPKRLLSIIPDFSGLFSRMGYVPTCY